MLWGIFAQQLLQQIMAKVVSEIVQKVLQKILDAIFNKDVSNPATQQEITQQLTDMMKDAPAADKAEIIRAMELLSKSPSLTADQQSFLATTADKLQAEFGISQADVDKADTDYVDDIQRLLDKQTTPATSGSTPSGAGGYHVVGNPIPQ